MTALLLLWVSFSIELQTNEPALAKVKRIYVDQLGGGPMSDQVQDMIVSALQNTGLFTITENRERADAVLKGSADEKIFNETHSTSESIGFRTSGEASSGSAVRNASSMVKKMASAGLSDNESSHIDERRREAVASVRLVAADGDVIWSTTQESTGGKFRGSLADVADKVARKLAEETSRARVSTLHAIQPLPAPQ